MEFEQVVVVGVGGIGGYLVWPLLTYLAHNEDLPKHVVLVDGDLVEEKNLARQFFHLDDVGQNKAEAWVNHLGDMDNIQVFAKPDYLVDSNAEQLIPEKTVVFSCVDNHFTRKIIHDVSCRLKDILVISGGNEYDDGNVQIFKKIKGKTKMPSLIKYHPEIEFPEDKNPEDQSCEELSQSAPQLLITNFEAAALMLTSYWRVLQGHEDCEVNFDMKTGNVLSVARK